MSQDGATWIEYGVFGERISMEEAEYRVAVELGGPYKVRLARYEEILGDSVTHRDGTGRIVETTTEPSSYKYEFWVTPK